MLPLRTELTPKRDQSSSGEKNEPRQCRILVVDDHPVFRAGLRSLIDNEPDLTVCGEAANAAEALDWLRRERADLAIVDISLPGANGIELVKNIRFEHPKLLLLIVSAYEEQLYGMRSLRAGASGYLMKRQEPGCIIDAIRKILRGEIWLSPGFSQQLIYELARGPQEDAGAPIQRLSDRELEVLQLLGKGRTTQEVADELHLSVKTVESHRLHIKEKLGLRNAVELVRFATEWSSQLPK